MSEADRWVEAWEEEVHAHDATRGEVELWRDRFHKACDAVVFLVLIILSLVAVLVAGQS